MVCTNGCENARPDFFQRLLVCLGWWEPLLLRPSCSNCDAPLRREGGTDG